MTLPPFDLHRARSVDEARELLDPVRRGRGGDLRRHGAAAADEARLRRLRPSRRRQGHRRARRHPGRERSARDRRRPSPTARSSARRSSSSACRRSRRWSAASRTSASATSARSAATSASPTRTPTRRRSCSRSTRRSSTTRTGFRSRSSSSARTRPRSSRGSCCGRSGSPYPRPERESPTGSSPSTSARRPRSPASFAPRAASSRRRGSPSARSAPVPSGPTRQKKRSPGDRSPTRGALADAAAPRRGGVERGRGRQRLGRLQAGARPGPRRALLRGRPQAPPLTRRELATTLATHLPARTANQRPARPTRPPPNRHAADRRRPSSTTRDSASRGAVDLAGSRGGRLQVTPCHRPLRGKDRANSGK